MNIKPLSCFVSFLMTICFFSIPADAVQTTSSLQEDAEKTAAIEGGFLQRIEDAKRVPAREKIEPRTGIKIPEIPQAAKEHPLVAADKVKHASIEQKQAEGKLTDTEAALDKDRLIREANLKY